MASNPFIHEAEAAIPDSNEPHEFGTMNRFVATFFFDTQPKRRAAYMKQFGYELNPKDDNEFRPVGSDGPYDQKLDLGGVLNFRQYHKDGARAGLSELGKDLIEATGDFIQGGATEAVGDAAGAAAGTVGTLATLNPAVGAASALAGRAAGRASAYKFLEGAKDWIGDQFLDEKIPVDQKLRTIQTGFQAVGPEVATKVAKVTLNAVSRGVRNLLDIGDGSISEAAWDAIKKNPHVYGAVENIKHGAQKLEDGWRGLFGLDDTTKGVDRIEPGSMFQKKLDELEPKRVEIVNRLSADPKNDIALVELIKPLEMKLAELEGRKVKSKKTQDGIEWVQSKLDEIRGLLPEGADPKTEKIKFADADSIVKEMQADLYTNPAAGKDWKGTVKEVVDGPDGFNTRIKEIHPAYGEVKAQEKKVLDAFDAAKENLSFNNVQKVIIGSNPSAAPSKNELTNRVTNTFAQLDDTFGTNLSSEFKEGQIQSEVFKAINNSGKGGGSRGVLGVATVAGGTAYAIGEKVSPGSGALAASIVAPAAVSLSQPKIGIPIAVAASRAAQAVDTPLAHAAAAGAARAINPDVANALAPKEAANSTPVEPAMDAAPISTPAPKKNPFITE